ncbi:MAG: FG-GAP repeat protein [Pseudomonadota bacterium]
MVGRTLGLLLLLFSAAAVAQPSFTLNVGETTVRPLDIVRVQVNFANDGSVADTNALLLFDPTLFSDVSFNCRGTTIEGLLVSCLATRDRDGVQLRARTIDGTPIDDLTLLEIVMTVAPTATPQITQVDVEISEFFDAEGQLIQGSGDRTTPFEIATVEPLPAVVRSRTNQGDALILPYLTSRGDRTTFFVLKNNSPFAKAIRLNLRDGAAGDELVNVDIGGSLAGALNVYLSPNESARFRIATSDAGFATLQTGACTVPVVPDEGLPLGAFAVPGKGDASVEGFATALVMADLGDQTEGILAQGNCSTLIQGFQPGGPWADDPTSGTVAPLGPISGIFAVTGLEGRGDFGGGATGLRGFSPGNSHRPPWEDFTLGDGQTSARILGQDLDFGLSAQAVSAVLMDDVKVLAVRPRGTEWLFTLPTKWLLTDPNLVTGDALPPFNDVFGVDGACDPVTVLPLADAVQTDFCFGVNVVPFDDRSLFDSLFAIESVASPSNLRGGIELSGVGLADTQANVDLAGLPVLAAAIPFRSGVVRRQTPVPIGQAVEVPLEKGPMEETQAGASVIIDGRLIFVGAPGANGGRGAVFVFRRHGTVFVPEQTLEIPPQFAVAEFGAAMDADGRQVVIGAPGDPGPPPKGGEGGHMQAAVWERATGAWNLKTPVVDQADADDSFGAAVSMEGDLFVVGAPGTDSGQGGDDNVGAVYIFDGGNATVVNPSTPAQSGGFGSSLAIKNGVMGVGSPFGMVLGSSAGSVSMFDDITNNLTPIETLTSETAADGDGFGATLAFNGTELAIGAPGTDGGDDGEVGNQGAVSVFSFDPDSSVFDATELVTADDAGINGFFGQGIALTDDGDLIVGAPGALGIFGSGALYEYSMDEAGLLLDEKATPDDDSVNGFGTSVAIDGEVIIIGAPQTAAEAGAALSVVDAEVLFFDDFESKLLR